MRLNRRLILGFGIFCIGVALIFYAIHAMQEIHEAKGFIEKTSHFFTRNPLWNPIVKFFGGKALEEASKHDTAAMIALVAGIILAITGAIVALIPRKK